jgi:protein involved in polysaccharide export with SLBB domain
MKWARIFKTIFSKFTIAIIAFGLMGSTLVQAQDLSQLTPDVLAKLKRSTETGKPINRKSPVDLARQQGGRSLLDPITGLPLKQGKPKLPSKLEEVYRERAGDDNLEQHGYDIFNNFAPIEQSLTGRVSGSYVLGIGDEIVVILTGSKETNYATSVDQEGRVVLPELGPISAVGKSFNAFQAELKGMVAKSFLGTEAFVSMGELKTINVFVLGNVEAPGRFQLTSMANPLEALSLAGGIKKTGSLRAIKIVQGDCVANNNCQVLDLYALSREGIGADIGLSDGARIIVPSLGPTVAVVGDVLMPGIFELAKGATSASRSTVLSYAGGTIRPRGLRFATQRIGDDGSEVLTGVSNEGRSVLSGDVLRVDNLSKGLSGHIILEGEVQVKGPRMLMGFDTVAKLVNGENTLGENPYLPFAILETADEKTKARNYKAFNLVSVITGAEDFRLADKDKIIILGSREIKFLSSSALRSAILEKENASQCRALDYLVDYMTLVGDDRFSATTRGFAVAEKEKVEEDKATIEDRLLQGDEERLSFQRNRDRIRDNGLDQEGGFTENEKEWKYTDPRYIFEGGEAYPEACSPLLEKNERLLPFILEYVVSVTGAVRSPGVYPLGSNTDLGSILSVAGGMAANADMSQIEVVSSIANADTVAATSRRYFDVRKTSMGNINITSRMTVRVPQLISNEESTAVVLSGEFMRPGVYTISKGEKLSQLMARAGGLTQFSYPYGGVLTRLSIARQEQEGYAQAAKNIESALTSAAVKTRNISGSAISAIKAFADNLKEAKAIGRLVTELDPAVLTVQPTKDIVLEGGDKIFMPKRPNHVLVSGDVLNPGALSFDPDQKVLEYVNSAGGVTVSGDSKRIFVIYPNGEASPVNISKWTYSGSPTIPPGSAIMVPIDLDPFTKLELASTISTLISQLAISLASIAVIAR